MQGATKFTIVAVLVGLVGCNTAFTPIEEEQPEVGQSASAVVGPEGGSIALGGATIDIPAGAVVADTEITVTAIDRPVPVAFSTYSRVFHFEPAGQVFEQPLTVSLPYTGSAEHATIFWTAQNGGAYMALPTRVEGDRAVAQITHFSDAFVGSGCAGADCCDPPNGQLDVLLVVDNSNSMSEEQAALAEQLPRMARVFATGDLDGDGEQDFPALHSVRVGIVTTDMGSGGYTIMTCDSPIVGDDGVLQTLGNVDIAGCSETYPMFAEFSADDGADGIDDFVEHVECVGRAGTGGCGFEHQLEASLIALTERAAPGQLNAGFLRDDSMVAVIVLSDEEDCSANNPEIFNPSRDDYGPMNVRCNFNPDEMHPVSRYVEGLASLREDPADVIFSLIAGVPADLVGDPEDIDFDTILDDERMTYRVNPANPNELLPSCESVSGTAYPPRRMVEVARDLDGVVGSICQGDFTPVVGSILDRVASRARGECR